MTFEQWMYAVCVEIQKRQLKPVELQDIYSSIDLTDSRLAYVDGEVPEKYKSKSVNQFKN
jgi:hypothetical protein